MTRTSKSISPRPPMVHKPAAVPMIQNERPSFGQTMKEGFGFGVGVSLAQNAVNGAINLFSVPKTSNPVENTKQTEFEKCMKYSSNDTDLCKTLLNN
jgi:hypothetical protein